MEQSTLIMSLPSLNKQLAQEEVDMENAYVNRTIINGTETQIQDYGRGQPNGVPVLDPQGKLPIAQKEVNRENAYVNRIIINRTETQIQDYGRDQPNGVPVLDSQGKLPAKYIPGNGIFRGKCLNGNPATMYPILPIGNTKNLPGGGYIIEQVMANIAAGNFDDIYIGDYFIDSENKVYRIAGLDTELNKGDIPLTSHHAVIVTDFALTNMGWNPTDTTSGGYQNSAIQAYCDGAGQAAIESVFGAAHVLTVRDLLSSAMDASAASPGYSAWQGVASSWDWFSHKVRLMSEVEVYGSRVFSGGHDIGTANAQFPLFRLMPQLATGLRYDYWLSGIGNALGACIVGTTGGANFTYTSDARGVRVRFLVG